MYVLFINAVYLIIAFSYLIESIAYYKKNNGKAKLVQSSWLPPVTDEIIFIINHIYATPHFLCKVLTKSFSER